MEHAWSDNLPDEIKDAVLKVLKMKDLSDEIKHAVVKELKTSKGRPVSEYPINELSEPRITEWVDIHKVNAPEKRVGEKYNKERLLHVLSGFLSNGKSYYGERGLRPINVVIRSDIKFEVIDGYHRLKVSEICGVRKIPVVYEKASFK